ncbi:conserved protein of unknown function [Magnetospirillum sp. XM-1]|uniref:hemerythrin family protein n=1 Tax=Magnetospirillum sp. XM-1 TaxID=1663591 RepID=UPI00073DC0D4|nr:hemerythrin family protein [Magnetospirillum sp. XM-1]CUW39725.1 conserved protein of unknown function [Magnetospirillum sp. XM-1]
MATWLEEQWKSGDPVIDSEHQKLHQMIASMAAVVRNDPGLGLADEAIEVLHDRMRIHFRMEEQLAARLGPDTVAQLKEDHLRLMALLVPVREAIRNRDPNLARESIEHFHRELDRHDREMDIPLFRTMVAGARP